MSWRQQIQVLDLAPDEKFEIRCRACNQTYTASVEALTCDLDGANFLYLDELEGRIRCRDRRCGGTVRLARVRAGDASAFIGGLA